MVLVRLFPHLFLSVALSSALTVGQAKAAPPRPVDLRHVQGSSGAMWGPAGPGGKKARLTLNPGLQKTAERLLAQSGAHEAAIVASDVRTGRILVWATRGDRDYVASPFAPSASLFKIVTASALLEGGRVNASTEECYAGGGEHAVTEHDLNTRGSVCVPMGEALGKSINLVFARMAKKHLASSDLSKMAGELGFSGDVPIDVPVGAGVVDIPEDPLGMARAAAGFWNGRITPLGALFAMQTIANEGERIRFSILDDGSGPKRVSAGRAISTKTAKTLEQMLQVTTKRGTCVRAFRHADGSKALPHVAVAAKTGTLVGQKPARMYSWFASFAPAKNPEIAVVVMLGNDLKWRTKANVVGRDMLEAYFDPNAGTRASKGKGKGGGRRRR